MDTAGMYRMEEHMNDVKNRNFDLVTFGQLLLRLSPPGNERLMRCDVFEKDRKSVV